MARFPKHLMLLPLLVLGIAFAMSATIQSPASAATSASLQVNFGSTPHWGYVPGTRVREVTRGQHPDYDVFLYSGRYYAYNNEHWYSSNRRNGRYRQISDNRVPSQFSRIPSERWKHYPSAWQNRNGDHGRGGDGRGQQPGGNDHHR